MKKLLIVHNFYKDFGGEDANIYEEIEFFEKEYEVSFFSYSNKDKINKFNMLSFIFRTNYQVNKRFKNIIDDFKPDVVYIHNTWFNINLGIFDILKQKNVKVLLKIHNFRYECSRHFFSRNHLLGKKNCDACGFDKPYFFIFNRYYKESYLKSFLLYLYSIKYFKILKNYPITLLPVSIFQKQKLEELGIRKEKIEVFNNPINFRDYQITKKTPSVVYAGRLSKEKGIEELINAWLDCNLTSYVLYIIGEGSLKNNLIEKYKGKNIKFLGYLPNKEVLDFISKAKAVVTATKLYEGQPRLLCEASSLGTISIYPSFGGMDEFFPKKYEFSFEQFNYKNLTKKFDLLENNIKYNEAALSISSYIIDKLNEEAIQSQFEHIVDS
jgi:glycosyltransferase involved in cell wall biosynthesis